MTHTANITTVHTSWVKLIQLASACLLAVSMLLASMASHAETEVASAQAAGEVANQANAPAPVALIDTPGLAKPTPGSLDEANQELLTKNAKLEQDINTLQTQVNVLIAERNNQLFMYGAIISLIAALVGFIAAWILLGRRQNW